MEQGEKNASTKIPEPEDPKDKKPLFIRIHLLFDGTNNNKTNIGEREKSETLEGSVAYKKHSSDDANSYDNGRTNIALMEEQVQEYANQNGYNIAIKVYVEGQGTFNLLGDATAGKAFGAMKSGVYQRARDGINRAITQMELQLFAEKEPAKHFIKQVDVDVFGFSRGAATARHAIHAMLTEETMTVSDPYGGYSETIVVTEPLYRRLQLKGYIETRADQIKINFAGLYDTVVSVNASQLTPRWLANNTRDQKAVKEAKFALHLAAADEHRSDFPLHRITSSANGKKAEFFLPGVHSDVGGSYNLANEKLMGNDKGEKPKEDATILIAEGDYKDLQEKSNQLRRQGWNLLPIEITDWARGRGWKQPRKGKLYRKIDGVEYMRCSSEIERIINRGTVSDLEVDMQNLKTLGWYLDHEIRIEKDYVATAGRLINPFSWDVASGKLIVNRYGIKSAYSYIPLKIMMKYSREHGVKIREKLDDRAKIVLCSEPELLDLEKDIQAYMSKKGNTGSKPEDWLNMKEAVTHCKNIKDIRNRHLHMSSRFNWPVMDAGFTPRLEKNIRKRFYYEG
jgi:Uncharacterized alpha/beta hydrolase domain (DUF2235)